MRSNEHDWKPVVKRVKIRYKQYNKKNPAGTVDKSLDKEFGESGAWSPWRNHIVYGKGH